MPKVSVIQMNSQDDIDDNLATAAEFISIAANEGAKIVLLPENFAFMSTDDKRLEIAEFYGRGKIQESIASLAKKHSVFIIAGTIPIKAENSNKKSCAASILYDSTGNQFARYDKIHLFDVTISNTEAYRESHSIVPGSQTIIASTPIANIGFSICYDVRFPELYRQYSAEGVDIITVPSAFTYNTGKAHWEILTRARAIENQCFVLAANQVGRHPAERRTYGHSMIINPWGEILAHINDEPGVITAELDFALMLDLQEKFPVREHRKLF